MQIPAAFTARTLTSIKRVSSDASMSARESAPESAKSNYHLGKNLRAYPATPHSRNVRVNDCIQRVQAAAEGASQARGRPPRIQSWS